MGDAADDAYRRAEQELEDGDAYALSLWETGDDGLLAILAIATPCCEGCDAEFAEGIPGAGTHVEILVGDTYEEVTVCCTHRDEIERKLREKGYDIL